MTEREADEVARRCRDAAMHMTPDLDWRDLYRDAAAAIDFLLKELEQCESDWVWSSDEGG